MLLELGVVGQQHDKLGIIETLERLVQAAPLAHTVKLLHGISLVGGTGDQGKVSANGRVYQDAVAYALVRNQNGRVKRRR